MNADEFRRLGHQLVDWVAEYRERIEHRPVMSPARPGEITSRFPASPPQDGGHLPEALALLEQDVLRGITHWNHPAFFAYSPRTRRMRRSSRTSSRPGSACRG